jgi:AcrR family transcriptional regulator
MNDPTVRSGTRGALLSAGRRLFAAHGYKGASVRAITGVAGANLGAVTYHFGSKAALYDAVLEQTLTPFRERLRAAAESDGSPLERVQAFIRAFFEHLYEHPELRGLMVRELSTDEPIPEAVLVTFQANFGVLSQLIREGQAAGEIREGDPTMLALATATQPVALNLVRPVLEQAGAVSFETPEARERLLDNSTSFVVEALAARRAGGEGARL